MNTRSRTCRHTGHRLLPVLAALLFLTPAGVARATDSACVAAAEQWIARLESPKSDILLSHARTRCDFAGRWLAAGSSEPGSNSHNELCTSLVLVWTHKECVYFRDDVDHQAYAPCETWTRRMHTQCMAGDSAWFLPSP